jgi:hypothetical protein
MKMEQARGSKRTFVISIGAAIIGLLGFSILTPGIYAYNDDAMMLSIVSGGYTGTPDGHMIYMAYPLSGLMALLYRLIRGIPWFPLFITSCYGAAAAGIWYRLLPQKGKARHRLLTAGLLLGGSLLFLLPGYIGLHYTLTAAILGGAGLVWLLTEIGSGSVREFVRDQVGTLVYLFFCCMVRKQVFYLILPFLGVAIIWNILRTKREHRTSILHGCCLFLGILCAGLLLIWVCNKIAYRGQDWNNYEAYNESRTNLYDYSGLLEYDTHQQTYDDLDISKTQYLLMENYDLMLDPEINSFMMDELAKSYMEVNWGANATWQRIITAVWEYRQCLLFRRDMPYSLAVFTGYALLALLCIIYRRFAQLLLTAATVMGRSLIWLFLFYQGRFPERVTISLYLIELLLLSGLLSSIVRDNVKKVKFLFPLGIILLLCLSGGICMTLPKVWGAAKENVEVQEEWVYLQDYFRNHPDTFYLLDVYSVTPYTDQPLVPGSKTFENWMLLGGWITASPTAAQKLAAIGADSAEQALLSNQTCLVMKTDRSREWLDAYCEAPGNEVQAVPIDTLTYEGEALFTIYQFKELNPTESP